ncbi:hypothetical protein [Novosphingobium huizhouense]|uniref:hypothetical protein n=1 Tax=Novosphingobium huizhouense TaxID=2866625 RepID=UPI001CD8CF23|nr:hypothetical protein [Novosphingobium huizhouense]
MAVYFKHRFKHGSLDLLPGLPLAFEDDRAEEYFICAGAADATADAPVVTYPAGSVEIDTETVFAGTETRVLGD